MTGGGVDGECSDDGRDGLDPIGCIELEAAEGDGVGFYWDEVQRIVEGRGKSSGVVVLVVVVFPVEVVGSKEGKLVEFFDELCRG